ncbi:hypothetical protein [Pseudomonas mangiferae]|uniref:Secreted protein n=1 Tax=Pseudomonas mangiferae TaxID=2593654 RepID=A0A553GT77_9PSED|nr:hypothetical protein [Pseudomonas mangiferae]TRX72718.1 hypothetical protein FM069_21420 [Pseudomonas mangiferae]
MFKYSILKTTLSLILVALLSSTVVMANGKSLEKTAPECPAVMDESTRQQHIAYLRWSLDKLQREARDMRSGKPLPPKALDRIARDSVDKTLERGIENVNFAITLSAYTALAEYQQRDPLFISEMQDYLFNACREDCSDPIVHAARDWVDYVVRPKENTVLPEGMNKPPYKALKPF